MSETSFMMKSHKVLTTSYLCRNPNSPISCDCAGAPLIPVLPDLPSCEHKVLWWIWLLGACLIILIVGAAVALYNRRKERRKVFCLNATEGAAVIHQQTNPKDENQMKTLPERTITDE